MTPPLLMRTSPAAPLLEYLLTPLVEQLEDPATEDLAINRPGEGWIRKRGAWTRVDLPFDLDALEEIAILAAALRHQDIGIGAASLCATELPGGERLQICLPPAVPHGSISLTIRKHENTVAPLSTVSKRYRSCNWNAWQNLRTSRDMGPLLALFDEGNLEGFLTAAVQARLNILLCGATGSGKTTLSKSLLGAIPDTERLITIEDTLELTINQPNNVRLLYSKNEYAFHLPSAIGANDLIEASLRMRPDRVLLQELRDDAAWTYLNEVLSGHPGSITTIHGHGAAEAFRRLFALAKSSAKGAALQDGTLMDLITGAVDLIVPMQEGGGSFGIGQVWFVGDAARRGETLTDLMR